MQKKNKIDKLFKQYLSVKEKSYKKWSESFFYNLFLQENVFFLSFKNPVEGYLIARKIINEYEILSLAIDLSKRRRGIGTLLLKKLINKAKKEEIHRILLEVSENNTVAISFYEKLGFKKVSKRKNYYKEGIETYDAHIMEKSILKYV